MRKLAVKSSWVEKLKKGYPWVYTEALKAPHLDGKQGELVLLTEPNNQPFAQAYYNPNSKLACRILTRDLNATINEDYFIELFSTALKRRERFINEPYYRLVHAEGDNLPG